MYGVDFRCLRCGAGGHQTGDRECPMRDQNPNDSWRKSTEDPMFQQLHKGIAKISPAHVRLGHSPLIKVLISNQPKAKEIN